MARRVLDRPVLRDVVDAALHDEDVCVARRVVEARHDLVRALAVDTAVAKYEPRLDLRGPVFPLTGLVTSAL
jgi:hypothetical protein